MMIIVGGEPELCCGMVRRGMAKRGGGVYACPYALRVCKSCLLCALCRKVLERVCVKWPPRKTDVQERIATPTRKRKYEKVRWSPSHFSLTVRCMGVSALCLPLVILGLTTTMHCTVHHNAHECGMAWQLGHVQHISIMWLGRTRLVGHSVCRSVGQITCSCRPR